MIRGRIVTVLAVILPAGGALPPAGPARAQIVNIESILTGEPQPGVEGALQLGFNLMQGNSSYRELEGSGIIRWRGGDHIVQLVAGGSYSTAGPETVSDNAMAHLRYGLVVSDRSRLEAFFQVQRDAFVRLRRRTLTGAGIRTSLLNRPAVAPDGTELERRFDLGVIVMREDEELRDLGPTAGWRASLLFSLGWGMAPAVFFGTQIYLQPLLSEAADHRLLGDGALHIRLLGPLSVQLGFRVVHDSRPPAGVKRTDLVIRNTLALTF